MANTPATEFKRATDYVEGIGSNLDAVQGRDVILRGYEVSNRPMRGESAVFVDLRISETDDPETVTQYHAWSDSLGEKIGQIPQENLPVLIQFGKTRTSSGFNVWTIS